MAKKSKRFVVAPEVVATYPGEDPASINLHDARLGKHVSIRQGVAKYGGLVGYIIETCGEVITLEIEDGREVTVHESWVRTMNSGVRTNEIQTILKTKIARLNRERRTAREG